MFIENINKMYSRLRWSRMCIKNGNTKSKNDPVGLACSIRCKLRFIAQINLWMYPYFSVRVYSTPTESVAGGNIFLYKHLTPMGPYLSYSKLRFSKSKEFFDSRGVVCL